MKPWNSRDQIAVRNIMRQQGNSYRPVYLVYPNKSAGSTYDAYSDAPADITTGLPTGQTITWTIQTIYGRIAAPTFTELQFSGGDNGYQIGDTKLFFSQGDESSVARIVGERDAFFSIDGNAYRPFSGINIAGLYQADERYVSLKQTTLRVRPIGY